MPIEFHNTVMGRIFYEGTIPSLVKQLTRLNENLEKLIEQNKTKDEPRTT